MTPGAVYDVSWIETIQRELGVCTARMRFQGDHPTGAHVFAYTDGFAVIAISPHVFLEAQPAEVNQ